MGFRKALGFERRYHPFYTFYRPQRKSIDSYRPPFYPSIEMEHALTDLRNQFDSHFGEIEREFPTLSTDIKESDGKYQVHVDLPGLKRNDIQLSMKDGVLSISGER